MFIICCMGWIAMDKLSHKLSQTQKAVIFASSGIVVFLFVFCTALIVGRYSISFENFFRMIGDPASYPMERSIVVNLRLPRTIIAALTGIALSLSGLLYQETFQNKLVSPDLLGVSSGSGKFIFSVLLHLFYIFVTFLRLLCRSICKNSKTG